NPRMPLPGRVLRPARRFRRRAISRIVRGLGSVAPLLPTPALPRAPIFVIGSPRSGTTLLYELLKASPDTGGLGGEGHPLWEAYHHPREHGWASNALAAHDVRNGEAQA